MLATFRCCCKKARAEGQEIPTMARRMYTASWWRQNAGLGLPWQLPPETQGGWNHRHALALPTQVLYSKRYCLKNPA